MFSFGQNYGHCEAVLHIRLGDNWDYVTPQTWQKHFSLFKQKCKNCSGYGTVPNGSGISPCSQPCPVCKGKGGETKTAKKNRHKALAQELFPEIKVTHQNADALLIAHYCREVHS